MSPPLDALGQSAILDPEEEFRRRMLRQYQAKYATTTAQEPTAPVPAAGAPPAAVTPPAPDPEASPPLVPDSTVRPQPYARPQPTTGTPSAAFATGETTPYPGVKQPAAPSQDLSPDRQAALMARAQERYGEMDIGRGGTTGLGREATPGIPFGKPQAELGIPPDINDPTQDSYLEREGRLMMSRAGDIMAGFTQGQSSILKFYANTVGDNMAGHALQGLSDFFAGSTESLDAIQQGYTGKYSDVGQALSDAGEGNFGTLFGFIAEQAPVTIADALASLAGMPAYLAATAGDFAQERAQNDGRGRDQLSAKDYAYGGAAAAVSFVLDKVLLGQAHPLIAKVISPEVTKKLADFGSSSTMKRVLTSGFRGAASETAEESIQQALTTVDTEKGATLSDIALAGAGGALAGGPASVTIDILAGHPSRRGTEEAIPPPATEDVAADAKAAIQAAAPGAAAPGATPPGPPPANREEWIKRKEEEYQAWRERAGAGIQRHPGAIAEPGEQPTPSAEGTGGHPDDIFYDLVGIPESKQVQQGVTDETAPGGGAPAFDVKAGARVTSTGEAVTPSRSERELREAYAPDKPVRAEGETDEAYKARIDGWHRNIEEHKARLKEQDEESWDLQNRASQAIVKQYRRNRALPSSAAARLLQNMVEPGGIEDGEADATQARIERKALTDFYTNLSNAARIAMGEIEGTENVTDAQRSALRKRLTQAATWMANSSANIQDFVLSEYKGTGSPKEGLSPFDRAYASFRLIDPLLLQMLGVDPKAFEAALSGSDIQPLVEAVNDISKKAYSRVQKYESRAEKAGRERVEGERAPLPELPKQAKQERQVRRLTEGQSKALREAARSRSPSKVQEAIQNITFQLEMGKRPPKEAPDAKRKPQSYRWWKEQTAVWAEIDEILTDFADVGPVGLHPPKSPAEATSETLYRDDRPEIQNAQGQWVENPGFGKRMKGLGPEQKAEIKQLQAEEARFLKGKIGFLDPDKVVVAKGPTGRVNIEKLSRRVEETEAASIKAYRAYVAAGEAFNEAQEAFDADMSVEAAAALQKAWGVRQQAGVDWLKASQAAHQASVAAGERSPRVAADVAAELEAQTEAALAVVAAHEQVLRELGGNPDRQYPVLAVMQRVVRRDIDLARKRIDTADKVALAKIPALESAIAKLRKQKIPPKFKADRIAKLEKSITRLRERAAAEVKAAEESLARVEAAGPVRIRIADAGAALTTARKDAANARLAAVQARAEADRLAGKPVRAVTRTKRNALKEIDDLRRGKGLRETGILGTTEYAIHYEPVTIKKKGLDEKGEPTFKEVVLHPTRVILGKPFAISETTAAYWGAKEEIARATQAEFDTVEGQRKREEAAAIEILAGEIRARPRQTVATRKAAEVEAIKNFMRANTASMTEGALEAAAVTFQREADARREAQEEARAAEKLEKAAEMEADLAAARAKLAKGETLTKEERDLIDEADAAAAAAAEAEGKEKPPPTPEQQAVKDARYMLDTFKNDVARGERPGDYAQLQAMAETVWDTRFNKRWIPKGLWVYMPDPVREKGETSEHFDMRVKAHEKEPYHFIHSIMPKIDARQLQEGTQQREKGAREIYKGRPITVYWPEQVEPSIGWKFGRTDVPVYDSSPHRPATEVYEVWPKKYAVFSTGKVDELVSDLTRQIGVDNKTARIMASILIYRAEHETNPSGTRGYNAATRRARREVTGPGVARPGTTVEKPIITPGKEEPKNYTRKHVLEQIEVPTDHTLELEFDKSGYWYFILNGPDLHETESVMTPKLHDLPLDTWVKTGREFIAKFAKQQEDEESAAEPVKMTPEQLQAFIDALNAGTFDNVSPATRQHFTSWITSLKEDIARHQQNIATAEAMLPKIEAEVGARSPDEDGVMEYPAPDGWPGGEGGINRFWRVKSRDGNVVSGFLFQLEPFTGTTDESYHKAIMGYVRHSIVVYRRDLTDLERKLENALEKWRQGGGGSVEGGGKSGVPVKPIVRVAPTSAGAPGYVDTGVLAPVSATVRESVDLIGGVEREPYTPDAVFDQFESFGDKGSVNGEPALTNKYLISADQKETAAKGFHTYKRRLSLLERGGAWLTSVNRSGFGGFNGTGSGKSISMAMLAHAISYGQPQDNFRRVLIVHQNGQPDAVRDAMDSLWHYGMDSKDEERWKFIPYSELETTQKEGEEFAAIIFDEAHWIKALSDAEGKKYAPAAAKIKTDFRAFFTATPTDAALQEEYYLSYMLQNIDKPLTIEQAEDQVRYRLDTHHKEGQTTAGFMRILDRDPPRLFRYIQNLAKMVEEAVAANAVTSFTLPPRLDGRVNPIAESQIAPGVASALATRQEHGTMDQRLNEHAKVEAMVERTLDLIVEGQARGEKPRIINVFEFSSGSQKTDKRDPYKMQGVTDGLDLDQPATMRMRNLLTRRAEERGIKISVGMMTGGEGRIRIRGRVLKSSEIAKKFQKGEYDVLIMTDSAGGTGINLDDSVGNQPRYTLIGGAKASGQNWIQLMGRTDRKSTVSTPYAEFMALPNSDSHDHPDRQLRDKIKRRVNIQRASVGMTGAAARGDIDLSRQLDKQPTFRKLVKGATPLHSTPVDQMVSQRLAEGPVTASSIVADIARNQTDPALAELAQALVGHPGLVGIRVASTTAGDEVLGYAQGRTAYVNTGTGQEAITALHEVFHHLSHWAIDNHPGYKARLLQIMRAVPPELSPMFEGVLTDPHEFATTAYTDPQFRQALKSIKAPSGVTLWQRFKEWMQVILGIRSRNFSALDAVLELNLTDPGTVTEHGSGDVSQQLATAMYRKRMLPEAVSNAAGLLSDKGDPAFRVLLASLTGPQIAMDYGKLATDPTGVNHLKVMQGIADARSALGNRERKLFDDKVLKPLYEWGRSPEGRRIVEVRTSPDGPLTKMPALQYLATIMNDSGYGGIHLGKDVTDKANAKLHPSKYTAPRMVKQKDGSFRTIMPRGRDRSHVIWDLHKKQFDSNGSNGLGQGGRDLYNGMAAFFEDQVDQAGVMLSQQFLDATMPHPSGKKWYAVDPDEVRAEVRKLGKLTDAELEAAGIQRKGLEHIHAILEPGRVPGAYFPLKRYGEWVVTVRQTIRYTDDVDKEAKMRQYFGATDDPNAKELHYYVMSRFEAPSVGEAFRERMAAEFPDATISPVVLSASTSVVKQSGLSESLLKTFEDRIKAQEGLTEAEKKAQIDLFTQAMIDLMPEASYADTFRPRKGVLGANLDIFRSLNGYGSAFSHYKSSAVFATQQREAARGLLGYIHQLEKTDGAKASKLRRISNELAMRAEIAATAFTEQRWAQTANDIGFAYYLVSASYNILNMSQVPLMTAPHLAAEHGMAATTNALIRAYRIAGGGPLNRLVRTGFTLSKLRGMVTGGDFDRKNYDVLTGMLDGMKKSGDVRHVKLLEKLAELGLIDHTISMDMTSGSRRSHVDREGNLRQQSKLSYFTDWMRMAPHITEVMNRAVTAVAAYDLQYAKLTKKGIGAAAASEQATEYAAGVINETQFNYMSHNKPRILQGNGVARTLLMFKQFPQHVYHYLITHAIRSSKGLTARIQGRKLTAAEAEDAKLAARQLAYMVGMHVLAAGAIGGIPEPVKWVIGWLSALFGDDDEPFDYELWVQQSMSDWLGPEWGNVAARGLPNLAGVDLSSRIGLNSLLMFDAPSMENPDAYMSDIFRIAGGPMVTLGVERPYQAYAALRDGNYTKAIEAVTPKVLRDPIRAYRVASEGYTTYAGRVYSEPNQIGPLELFFTSMGLNPSSTSQMYLSRTIDNQVDAMQGKRTDLMKNAYFARNDSAAWHDSIATIRRWNQDNRAFQIDMSDLVKSFKGRARNQAKTHGGMLVPEKYRTWAEQQNRFRGIPYPGVMQ